MRTMLSSPAFATSQESGASHAPASARFAYRTCRFFSSDDSRPVYISLGTGWPKSLGRTAMISDKSLKSVSNDHKALLSGSLGLKSFGFRLTRVFSRVLVLNGCLPLVSFALLAVTRGRGRESAAKLRFFCGVGTASDLPALDSFAE